MTEKATLILYIKVKGQNNRTEKREQDLHVHKLAVKSSPRGSRQIAWCEVLSADHKFFFGFIFALISPGSDSTSKHPSVSTSLNRFTPPT